MWLFSSEEKECEGGEHSAYHEGPFVILDKTYRSRFYPEKQDGDYIYGYTEMEPYAACESCGEEVKHHYRVMNREFTKVLKEDIPEEDITELEVALDVVEAIP